MIVLVCGGRDFGLTKEEHEWICGELEKVAIEYMPRLPPDEFGNWLPDVKIISGGAKGVDEVAIDWAVVNWCAFEEFPADWKKYGNAAGPIRNQQMLDEGKPNLVVAFPGGNGTADMVKRATKAGIKVIQIQRTL